MACIKHQGELYALQLARGAVGVYTVTTDTFDPPTHRDITDVKDCCS